MDLDNLIHMANRIGAFFAPMPDRSEALEGIANHIHKFWDPRMRRQLLASLDDGQMPGLDEIVREALVRHRGELG